MKPIKEDIQDKLWAGYSNKVSDKINDILTTALRSKPQIHIAIQCKEQIEGTLKDKYETN